MKYKALMIDLDGTTVPHFSNDVRPRVLEAIKKAHDLVSICLVTGRPLGITLPLIEKLEITGPCCVHNGAQIYDPIRKKTLYQLFLPEEDIQSVYEKLLPFKNTFFVYDGTTSYPAQEYKNLSRVMSFFVDDISPDVVQEITKLFHNHPHITTNRMLGTDLKNGMESIEIINVKATKQFGIFEVAKLLHIDTHEIIGVGDGYNDFALLMACGVKIAMGNAVDELKAIADFIAPSVDDDGLATVIEKFILEK